MEDDFCSRETLSRPEDTANRIRGYNSVAVLRCAPHNQPDDFAFARTSAR